MTTVGDVLETRLRQLGVMRVYGSPLASLRHIEVAEPDVAVLLADADGRIGHHDGSGRLGAAFLDGPILHLSSEPGGTAPLQRVTSVEELADVLADPVGMTLPGTLALHLDLDLDAPADEDALVAEPQRQPVVTLDPDLAELDMVVVVGPGVVRANGLDGLYDFTRSARVGVLNTWGAKGVERWDSPFHFGTAGLQSLDFALGGLEAADIVIASGLDPDESPLDALGSFVVQEVHPRQIGALTHGWRDRGWKPRTHDPTRPPLYGALAEVITPMYESDSVPLTAPRASLHLAGAIPEGGIVVADPGPAGFWVARTLPTALPGSVCVPATVIDGFAAAAALVCALEERPCLAVSDQGRGDDGLDESTAAVLELAEALGMPVGLQLWGADGTLADSMAHVSLLEAELAADTVRIDEVPVELGDTEPLEMVAGRLVAWN